MRWQWRGRGVLLNTKRTLRSMFRWTGCNRCRISIRRRIRIASSVSSLGESIMQSLIHQVQREGRVINKRDERNSERDKRDDREAGSLKKKIENIAGRDERAESCEGLMIGTGGVADEEESERKISGWEEREIKKSGIQ